MNSDRLPKNDLLERIHKFVVDGANNELTEIDWTDFERLLRENDDACRLYAQYIDVSVLLPDILASMPDEDPATPESLDVLFSTQPVPAFTSITSLPVTTWHGTIGYFSSSWPLAYMISAVLIGLSLFTASFFYVSHPDQIANIQPTSPSSPAPRPLAVARVTGMIDCDFSGPETTTFAGANVPLGRKYALSAGLMEITYDTGPKVILQGPCTYEVTSADSGHLAVGRLTARVEKKVASGKWQVASAENHKSLTTDHRPLATSSSLSTIHYPLFTIETPTATVTDLGTEFAVEVSKTGESDVHVYEGEVTSRSTVAEAKKDGVLHLKAGQAVRMEAKNPNPSAIPFSPKSFARRLPRPGENVSDAEKAYIAAVLADKPLAYWPLNETANSIRFTDRSQNGFSASSIGKVVSGEPGPFGDKSRAVKFTQNSSIDIGCPDVFSNMPNGFSVEAWVTIDYRYGVARLISFDDSPDSLPSRGWALGYVPQARQEIGSTGPSFFFTIHRHWHVPMNAFTPPLKQWTYVACTFDKDNVLHSFINGQPQASAQIKPINAGRLWGKIGAMANGKHQWYGRIAHVAVYQHLLDAEQVKKHYLLVTEKQQSKYQNKP